MGTGRGQEWLGHLDKVSDEHGFVVVYPDGLSRSWADGRGGSPSDQANVNDVKFISQLIDRLAAKYSIDSRRLYVTGMSNGGFMSGRLACELSEKSRRRRLWEHRCQFPPLRLANLREQFLS